MKMEEHFKDTLDRVVANEPPVIDSWVTFERRVRRDRGVRVFSAVAAMLAVIVAAAIFVPKLGRDPLILTPSTDPPSPSPSPSPSIDEYAGWDTFTSPVNDRFSLRHPREWTVLRFENSYEVLPPGEEATVTGAPTAAVALELLQKEEFDSPDWRRRGFDRSTRPDGRPYVWNERLQPDGGRTIDYRFDWSTCVPTMEPRCIRGQADTLVVTIELGTRDRSEEYGDIAERIVASIRYTGPIGPFSVS